MSEVWKYIPGYEGIYSVSSLGRVKSESRYTKRNRWDTKSFREGVILKQRTDNRGKGYKVVSLYLDGIGKNHSVHRLVAAAFLNLLPDLHVNHLNGVTGDNRIENLEVCTATRNRQHAFETGLQIGLRGEKSHYSKLTKDQVEKIRVDLPTKTDKELALEFNVNSSSINRIRNNKTWVAYS